MTGLIQSYGVVRKNSKRELYWQVLMASHEVRRKRIAKGIFGKRNLLKETAKMLLEEYGWETPPDSYVVRRYLDRAEKIWSFAKIE